MKEGRNDLKSRMLIFILKRDLSNEREELTESKVKWLKFQLNIKRRALEKQMISTGIPTTDWLLHSKFEHR